MLRSAKELKGYRVMAQDGDIGKVHDFFFDDDTWSIRYLVVDTGTWLPGRKVLISPLSLGEPRWETTTLAVNLTRDRIENSPRVDADKPISRQREIELHEYYQWVPYWTGYGPAGAPLVQAKRPEESRRKEQGDPHLRSMREVTGYGIAASDGDMGHVEDFIVEDETWVFRYLVIDTRNWLPGRKVIIAPAWIDDIVWDSRRVVVGLPKDSIKNSPEYDPSTPVNREYEIRLYDYYGRPKYWQ